MSFTDTAESRSLTLADVEDEAARLVRARKLADGLKPMLSRVVDQLGDQLSNRLRMVEDFRSHTEWVLSDPGLDEEARSFAIEKSGEITSSRAGEIGQISTRLAVASADLALEQNAINEARQRALADSVEHLTDYGGELYELAAIEAYKAGKAPNT